MSRLTQTEYSRRNREKQRRELDDLKARAQRAEFELSLNDRDLRIAYHTLDVFEAALARALGRPVQNSDLDYNNWIPGSYSRSLRSGAAHLRTESP